MIKKKYIPYAIVNIKSTLNNTLITVTDLLGNVIYWISAGTSGFKGAQKKTPLAAQKAAKNITLKLVLFGIKKINIILTGKGIGKEPSLKVLISSKIEILSIVEKTAVAFNGCRLPKQRRL